MLKTYVEPQLLEAWVSLPRQHVQQREVADVRQLVGCCCSMCGRPGRLPAYALTGPASARSACLRGKRSVLSIAAREYQLLHVRSTWLT